MKRKGLIIIITVIFLSNLPIFDYFTLENFTYRNIDGSFTYSEEANKGGRSYAFCQFKYGHFLCQHPEKDIGDNNLYRTFTIKPWYFWEWHEFIFHSERFRLPYLDPESLKRR